MVALNPQIVVWEYTLACNSHCIHCGSDARTPRKDELSTEEAISLVHQIKKVGFKRLILSGGEPTLRQDWVRIAEESKAKFIPFEVCK